MIPSPRMVRANHALRSLQIFECLSQYRPTFVGSTPIDIDLDESDLDIICEAHDLNQFEEQNRLLYGSRTNFRSTRAVKYGLPCILISFYSHSFRIGIFGQPKAIEEQAAYLHMKVEERLLEIGGEVARESIRELKRKGFKTEPAFASYFQLSGDPYQSLLDLAPYSTTELQKRVTVPNQQEALLAQRAYDLFGREYIETYPDDVSKFEPLIAPFANTLAPGVRVLDIGCGNGAYVDYFLRRECDAIGIDISETMLSEARKLVPASRLFSMDMHDMSQFSDSSFDAIISITAMLYTSKKHLPKIIGEVHRLLAANGRFLFIMLEGSEEGVDDEEFFGKKAKTYGSYYSTDELQTILESCGFSIENQSLTNLVIKNRREITLTSVRAPV